MFEAKANDRLINGNEMRLSKSNKSSNFRIEALKRQEKKERKIGIKMRLTRSYKSNTRLHNT